MARVRFAPSPTGTLHIGGARTALFNYLFVRKIGGTFILRIDDTDRERSRSELESQIKESLNWLGMSWDEGPEVGGDFGPYRQSEKTERHVQAGKQLLEEGKAYEDDGAVRIRYNADTIVVNDLVCGECTFAKDSLGPDPVILRSDGSPTYHLASVVDDIDMKITHIIRGQDHLTNTAKHKVLFEALGAEVPQFAHLPLILGGDGGKLSKRNSEGLISVTDFKEKGFVAPALNNFLMLLGWSHPESKEQISLAEGIDAFDLGRVGQTGAVFDETKLKFLNGWWIRNGDLEVMAAEALEFAGEYRELAESRGQKGWVEMFSQLRDGFSMLSDVEPTLKTVFDLEIQMSEQAKERFAGDEERGQCKEVLGGWLELLNETSLQPDRDCYSKEQFSQLLGRIKKQFSFNKKLIFQSVRLAIMGELSGPELGVLVPLISRDLLISRAEGILSELS